MATCSMAANDNFYRMENRAVIEGINGEFAVKNCKN